MSIAKKEFIDSFIKETVKDMQDILSVRIGEKEREIDALMSLGEMVDDENYAAIEALSAESRILGEIRDDAVEHGKYKDIRQILFEMIDIESLQTGNLEYIKTLEEEIALKASTFSTELEALNESEGVAYEEEASHLHIILQAKIDILTACIETLREKELLKRLQPFVDQERTLLQLVAER